MKYEEKKKRVFKIEMVDILEIINKVGLEA
jgi:hypothetical protein